MCYPTCTNPIEYIVAYQLPDRPLNAFPMCRRDALDAILHERGVIRVRALKRPMGRRRR